MAPWILRARQAPKLNLPTAPIIYVSDPTPDQCYARELQNLIPCCNYYIVKWENKIKPVSSEDWYSSVSIIADTNDDYHTSQKIAHIQNLSGLRTAGHLVTINIMHDLAKVQNSDDFGIDHLDVLADTQTAAKIYKWLFSVLTVHESLHLIPDEEMVQTDTELFPDYAYCTIADVNKQRKDAKVQLVGLILTKPQVSDGKKLTWTVADKTGTANFYFQYRGPESQYTWDWVMGMKPGDRKALPRMPMVQLKERKRVRIIKAPFRATGAVIYGTGFVLAAVAQNTMKLGKALKMGSSKEWVLSGDVGPDGKRIDWTKVEDNGTLIPSCNEKPKITVFNENGERNWSDDASIASTNVGGDIDEKMGKEFC